jgi:DNA-binding CsgD family transcriptional regulator
MGLPASLLGIIAESIPEAVLIVSAGGRLEAVNAAAAALTGLDPAAAREVTLAELTGDVAGAQAIVAVGLDDSAGRERRAPLPLQVYGPSCRPCCFHARSWRITAGREAAVGIRLTEPDARQHRRVLARIAEGLTSTRSLPAAECQAAGLAAAITEVCALTGWAYAEAWVPAEPGACQPGACQDVRQDAAQWAPHPFWYGSSRDRYQAFRELSVKAAAAAPLPLVSRVAREQSSSWYSDVSVVPLAVYRRARAAREAGLKATFAQPIVEGGRTLAVLVFMMAEARARDDSLAALMTAVARQLAPLFRIAPAQAGQLRDALPRRLPGPHEAAEVPPALALVCRLLDSLGKTALVVDHDTGSVAWANAAACRTFGCDSADLAGLPAAQLHVDARAFEESGRRSLALLRAGKPFRYRARLQRRDATRFAGELLVVPLGDVAGCRLSVSLVTDLSETARLTFGGRLDQLSGRELEVFQLTIVGATVTEIAASLDLSGRTVEGHRSHLLRKLGCASTTKLLAELLAESVVERARM